MNKFAALFLLTASLFAQPAEKHALVSTETRLYEVKNLSGIRVEQVCLLVNRMIGPEYPGASVQPVSELKAIVIQGKPEAISKAEELLKRYDVPAPANRPPAATLTIYLVRGSATPPEHPHPVPPELESVVAEMKRSFAYDSYTLYDTVVMNSQTDNIESMVPGASFNGSPYFYSLHRSPLQVDPQTKTIDIQSFVFSLKVPYQTGNNITGTQMREGISLISTGVHIQEGQKLVLGKVKVDPLNNTDLFLVLTVKLQ